MTVHNMKQLNDAVILFWVLFAPLLAGPIDKQSENSVTIVRTFSYRIC